ncbi:MAG: hypothetical protein R2705_25610, partial [Ilumatobacteraceae bacterium]
APVAVGQRIDLPLPLPDASCRVDGGVETMPDIADATVQLTLDDGTQRTVPVFDRDRVARSLYLRDCERQAIDDAIWLRWEDLHPVEVEGRPVTEGTLRLTRRAATGEVVVQTIGSSVIVALQPVGVDSGAPVLRLGATDDEASVQVRFTEARCDAHAVAETSQPFLFVAQVEPGDGFLHPYVVAPDPTLDAELRATHAAGCEALDELHPLDEPAG